MRFLQWCLNKDLFYRRKQCFNLLNRLGNSWKVIWLCVIVPFIMPQIEKKGYTWIQISHSPSCKFQNINVHISVLNGVLWDMRQVHCGICEFGLLVGIHWVHDCPSVICVQCRIIKIEKREASVVLRDDPSVGWAAPTLTAYFRDDICTFLPLYQCKNRCNPLRRTTLFPELMNWGCRLIKTISAFHTVAQICLPICHKMLGK